MSKPAEGETPVDWLKVKYSYHCTEHGWWDAKRESGCPNCVIQLRRELAACRAELDAANTALGTLKVENAKLGWGKTEAEERLRAAERFYEAVKSCMGDTWECRCGHSEPWWNDSNADYLTREFIGALSRDGGDST